MFNTPVSHKQLRYLIADQLRNAIFDGHYKPGEWLRQEHLAQELGVSQMPVREALKELAAEGLIEHVPYRGVRVIAFSADDAEDLYVHRAFLESKAARAAAEHISPKEIAELKKLQEQMEANLAPEQLAVYRDLNRRFHYAIFKSSQRGYLTRTLSQMWAAFPTMLVGNFAKTAANPLPERDKSDMLEHHALIASLEQHNPDAAEQAMRSHIENTGRHLAAALRHNR